MMYDYTYDEYACVCYKYISEFIITPPYHKHPYIIVYTYAYSDAGGAGAAGPGRQGAPGRGI